MMGCSALQLSTFLFAWGGLLPATSRAHALSTTSPPVTPLSSKLQTSLDKPLSPLSENQKALDSAPPFPRTWVPIASATELDPDRPTPVNFLGQNYVVYEGNNPGEWVVADNACPHRLAPLSEGRIDTLENGERQLQCAYHGWSFDDNGNCRSIPQVTAEAQEKIVTNPRCNLKSYTTIVEKGVVWMWPWKEDAVELSTQDPTITPEVMMQGIASDISTYTRDLPYGWDTLTENLIDPAHIPFAHHGLQGTRDDAVAINMTMPSKITQAGFDFTFEDRTMNKFRRGEASFRAPYTLVYSGVYPGNKGFFNLTTINIPTKPGWSRAIVMTGGSHSRDADGNPMEKQKSLVSKIFGVIPTWLIHVLSTRFLNSDLAFLHYQEQEREKRGCDTEYAYFMPAPADRAIIAFRKWKSKYAHVPLPLPPPINTRAELFDHYTQHTSHCRHCSEALEGVKKNAVRTKGLLVVSVFLAATKFPVLGSALVALCIGFLQILKITEGAFMSSDYQHYKND